MQRTCASCGEAKARPETKRRFFLGVTTGLPLGEEMRFRCHGCGARFGIQDTTMRVVHGGLAVLGVVLFFALMPVWSFTGIPGFPTVPIVAPWLLVVWAAGTLVLDAIQRQRNPPS